MAVSETLVQNCSYPYEIKFIALVVLRKGDCHSTPPKNIVRKTSFISLTS